MITQHLTKNNSLDKGNDKKKNTMKAINLNKILLLFLAMTVFTGCVQDDDFDTPDTSIVEPNIAPADIVTISSVAGQLAQAMQDEQPIFTYEFENGVEKFVEGYIISSDEGGNFFEEFVIQDAPENPTAGLRVLLDVNPLFTRYEIGRKVYVRLNDLTIGISNGVLTIGKLEGIDGAGKIPPADEDSTIFRSAERATIVPMSVNISDINDSMLNTFIQINNAQVSATGLGLSYASEPSDEFDGERVIESCTDGGSIILSTSTFSDFKALTLPSGSGSISGVLTKNFFGDTNNLAINSPEDVDMNTARCDIGGPLQPTMTIGELRGMFSGSNLVFPPGSNEVVEGYVVSSDQAGNFFKNIFIQDKPENPTAALQILVDENDLFNAYPVGSRVLLKLDNLYAGLGFGDIFSVGYIDGGEVDRIEEGQIGNILFATGDVETIVATPANLATGSLTINELDENGNTVDADMDGEPDQIAAPEGILLEVNDVQMPLQTIGEAYAFYSGTDSANRVVESCESNASIILRNSGFADFASQPFPTGRGSVKAVLGQFFGTAQLLIRNTNDVNLAGDRCDPILLSCGLAGSTGDTNLFADDFETQTPFSLVTGNGWTNFIEEGTQGWEAYTQTGTNSSQGISARMGSFSSGDASSVAWLITPQIDLDANADVTFQFESSNSFSDGSTMEVMFSKDWDGTEEGITSATWGIITDAYVTQDTDFFGDWFGSGIVDLSCETGQIYIAFKYVGSGDAGFDGTYELDFVSIDAQ